LEPAGRGLLVVLAIDIEQLGDARRSLMSRWKGDAAQPLGQRVADARQALGAKSRDCLQSAVVRGGFEVRECLEPQLVVQTLREDAPDAGHRCEQCNRIGLAAQSIEHRQTAVSEEFANRPGDALPDVRQLFQPFEPTLAEKRVQGLLPQPDGRSRTKVCADPEAIGALIAEEATRFLETAGDLFVDAGHAAIP
jgi:hypothetical protein